MGVEEIVAMTRSKLCGEVITRLAGESSTDSDQLTHLAISRGVMYTYDEILRDASLQSLSYLEEVVNLGMSE